VKVRSIILATVVALAGVAVPLSVGGASAAAGVTVKGTAPGAAKVFLLTKKGRAYRANVEASGAFSIAGVPGTVVKNSTLQFTDATSKYIGTAVFRVLKSGAFYKSIVGLKAQAKGTLNVGALKAMGGWYKAAKPLAAGTAGIRCKRQDRQAEGCWSRGAREAEYCESCFDVDAAQACGNDMPRRQSEGRRTERHRCRSGP